MTLTYPVLDRRALRALARDGREKAAMLARLRAADAVDPGRSCRPAPRAPAHRPRRDGCLTMGRAATKTAEDKRLAEAREKKVPWRRWGPYVSERQWGTVREDYSAGGDRVGLLQPRPGALARLPLGRRRHRRHLRRPAAAVLRARAVERRRPDPEGAPVRPHRQRRQPRRGREGVLLLPRQRAEPRVHEVPVQVPAAGLSVRAAGRGEPRAAAAHDPEFELLDTGIFDDDRYFDVFVEYAKAGADDILVRITAVNRGPDAAPLHLLPTLWFRNDWSWSGDGAAAHRARRRRGATCSHATHAAWSRTGSTSSAPDDVLFTENESNARAPVGPARRAAVRRRTRFDDFVVHGARRRGEPRRRRHQGRAALPALGRAGRDLRRPAAPVERRQRRATPLGSEFDALFARRMKEADAFYRRVTPVRAARRTCATCSARPSPACCGASSTTTTSSTTGCAATPRARRRPSAQQRPQPRWAHLADGRRAVDARQVGVPVVRGLGHGVPLRRLRADRRRLREGAADPADARVVHAPERPDPGLRMGLRRREPAGACLGRDPHLPDRAEDDRPRWTARSSNASSASC